jgi:hypothetical protein
LVDFEIWVPSFGETCNQVARVKWLDKSKQFTWPKAQVTNQRFEKIPSFRLLYLPKKMFVAHFLWGMSTFQKLVGFHAENLRAAVLWASTVGPHWFIFAFGGYIASGN